MYQKKPIQRNAGSLKHATTDYQPKYKGLVFSERPRLIMNPKQIQLYKQLIHGVGALTEEQQKALGYKKVSEIAKTRESLMRRLNLWKQEMQHEEVNKIMLALFPKSKFINDMVKKNDLDSEWTVYTLFKDLNINQETFIKKLIQWKFLPSNFYQL